MVGGGWEMKEKDLENMKMSVLSTTDLVAYETISITKEEFCNCSKDMLDSLINVKCQLAANKIMRRLEDAGLLEEDGKC